MTPACGAAAFASRPAEMASEPPPVSTGGAPRTPSDPHVSYTRRCVVLVDWWLERVVGEEGKIRVAGYVDTPQMRKGELSLKKNRKVAGRVFRSAVIAKRLDYNVIETEDGYRIRICSFLNIPKTCENGFPKEVYEFFETGFPFQWHELVHPNIEQENEHAQSTSETTANAPRHSVEYYMEKYTSDSFPNVLRYAFTENDFFSSAGHTSDRDGIDGGRTVMPEKPLTPPGETCTGGQESEQHGSMQIHTSEQEIVNRPFSSASVTQSTNSKVDGSILAPSKIVSVEKEGYRSRVCRSQPEEDADIQHKNMQRSSSEQTMVTLPVDSAIVNENLNYDLGEPATLKCGKASVNLGTRDALELPSERMTPQSGAVPSEDSTVRRLRSGKVFGTPSGGTMKRGRKKKKIQHEASSKNMEPKEGAIFTADLTSRENGLSAAGIVAEDKQDLHDSQSERCERLAKKAKKRKSESTKLFWNWL